MKNTIALSLMLPVDQIERLASYKQSHKKTKRAVIREAIEAALDADRGGEIIDPTKGPYINVAPVYVTEQHDYGLRIICEDANMPLTAVVRWALNEYFES